MTEKQLSNLCACWQKIMRLQDWKVKVAFCRQNEMVSPESHAETHHQFALKAAKIFIMDPIDLSVGEEDDYDIEQALVHELYHLRLLFISRNMKRDTLEYDLLEQAVDVTADALTQLYRFYPTKGYPCKRN